MYINLQQPGCHRDLFYDYRRCVLQSSTWDWRSWTSQTTLNRLLSTPPDTCSSTQSQFIFLCTPVGGQKCVIKMAAAYKTYDRSQQQKHTFSIQKLIIITWNFQYFVDKYFPSINECSWRRMDAYKFRIYSINTGLKIPQAELTNSDRVLITSVSICSFCINARNTFSVTFKSGDRAGQVVPEILYLVFNSREKLSTACRCTSSLNIKVFTQNLLRQKGLKFTSKICTYLCKLILSLSSN